MFVYANLWVIVNVLSGQNGLFDLDGHPPASRVLVKVSGNPHGRVAAPAEFLVHHVPVVAKQIAQVDGMEASLSVIPDVLAFDWVSGHVTVHWIQLLQLFASGSHCGVLLCRHGSNRGYGICYHFECCLWLVQSCEHGGESRRAGQKQRTCVEIRSSRKLLPLQLLNGSCHCLGASGHDATRGLHFT